MDKVLVSSQWYVFHLIPYLYDSLPCLYHPKYRWLMKRNKIKIVGNVAMFWPTFDVNVGSYLKFGLNNEAC